MRIQANFFRIILRRIALIGLLISTGLDLTAIEGAPQTDSSRDAAGIRLLARQFVDAVNHKSVSEQVAILHPKSRACIRPKTQSFFDGIFSRRLTFDIPANYVVGSAPRSPEYFSPPEAITEYPVRPTHTLQIEYYTGPRSSTTIDLSIVKVGTTWYEVLPCPSPEAMKRLLAEEADVRERNQRVQKLVSGLGEPMRSDLETLVNNGHRDEAIKRYQNASGEDLSYALSVIDALVPRK